MASVVKVPIAMLIASEIANGALSLHEKITIHSRAASPGPIVNPLDRFYFLPFETVRTHTVEHLMSFMILANVRRLTPAFRCRPGREDPPSHSRRRSGRCSLSTFLSQVLAARSHRDGAYRHGTLRRDRRE